MRSVLSNLSPCARFLTRPHLRNSTQVSHSILSHEADALEKVQNLHYCEPTHMLKILKEAFLCLVVRFQGFL